MFDVGTGDPETERLGAAFATPQLRYLWMSAPYYHDGSAPTLRDVFTGPGVHNLVGQLELAEIDALVTYLLSR
jgi:cytochrome c peroxidase